jgi:ATP phosphoribosyltransferase regulatory subunit
MQKKNRYFSKVEEVSAVCREIYSRYGYRQYKMSRFEEYDLYAANKDFLVSDSIITFTERNGKLMALKPDVTLSIVKNVSCEDKRQEKVFYLENVYRTSKGTSEFKEIMQLGLECIGDVGLYQTGEVMALAARSLAAISGNYILDISHMGFIAGLADAAGIDGEARDALLKNISGRNAAGVRKVCAARGVPAELAEKLAGITGVYGSYKASMPLLEKLSANEKTASALLEIRGIYGILEAMGCAENVNIDISHTGDMKYYNGITFCGYIKEIPFAVLSGGRYDSLLKKFGKPGGAVGFAIYLDQLEALPESKKDFDVDTVLITGEADGVRIAHVVQKLIAEGKSVLAVRELTENCPRCREIIEIDNMKTIAGDR